MAKEKRDFRLSRAALEAIENRDKVRFPTATEYVEQSVLKFEKSCEQEQISKQLQKLDKNIQEILINLREDESYPNI